MDSPFPILSWNVRGANTTSRQDSIREAIEASKAKIVVLLETRIRGSKISKACNRFWPEVKWISNHNSHPLGIIIILWDKDISITILDSSEQVIHLMVKSLADKVGFVLSTIYGDNDDKKRDDLWNSIMSISMDINTPWLLMGDFNSIRLSEDRVSRASPSLKAMAAFNYTMEVASLFELPRKSLFYTWDNK